MGGSSSKPVRRLGNQVSSAVRAPEAPAAARAAPAAPTTPKPPLTPDTTPKHTKDAGELVLTAIEHDAMDPQLVRNLASLGQVVTGGSGETVQRNSPMVGILAARGAAANDQSGLPAGDLVRFLDEYKHSERSQAVLERLAIEYDIPQERAAALVRWVSTPGQQPLRW